MIDAGKIVIEIVNTITGLYIAPFCGKLHVPRTPAVNNRKHGLICVSGDTEYSIFLDVNKANQLDVSIFSASEHRSADYIYNSEEPDIIDICEAITSYIVRKPVPKPEDKYSISEITACLENIVKMSILHYRSLKYRICSTCYNTMVTPGFITSDVIDKIGRRCGAVEIYFADLEGEFWLSSGFDIVSGIYGPVIRSWTFDPKPIMRNLLFCSGLDSDSSLPDLVSKELETLIHYRIK